MENELARGFRRDTSGGVIGENHWEFGKKWIGKTAKWKMGDKNQKILLEISPPFPKEASAQASRQLESGIVNPLSGKVFRRLFAERSVIPEADSPTLSVVPNGRGLTNTIQCFLNKDSLLSDLVEITLLNELNKILGPDSSFTRILVKQGPSNEWEIFLEESDKGKIRLSHSGSGLKTILLVLAFVHLMPVFEKKILSQYVFAFEELENNLHPALQRRLMLYLREIAEKNGCLFFLTTHSNVAIDFFSTDVMSQILHVTHNGDNAKVSTVKRYQSRKGVLDDLDVRASDLLQSNGVVWVEGPSDRLYFNKWIEVLTNGALREGVHYQCVFYGGRLLSHLVAEPDAQEEQELINILMVNKNVILIMDSDKTNAEASVSKTKLRITEELESIGGLAWITDGREVENYIPMTAFERSFTEDKFTEIGKFDEIESFLRLASVTGYKAICKSKVLFAEKVLPHIDYAGLSANPELCARMSTVIGEIKRWNTIA